MIETMFRVATEFDVVKVRVTKEGEERIARLNATGKFGACLGCETPFTGAEDEVIRCGQCSTCYNGSLYAINKGRTTRARLIRDGKMLAPTGGGRKPANSFTQSLKETA